MALPQTSNSSASKKPAATTAKKGAAAKTTMASSTNGPARKGRTVKGRSSTAVSYRQTAPTPERYKEIQQALADKGYLKSEPNGVWDDQSSDAMKQFQNDKNLPSTGKITSASLIGLGLGPKSAGTAVPAPAPGVATSDPPIPPAPVPAPPPVN